ncbi:SDR family NAD(P)-dependent oxidoreductase [Streptomyces sp. NPDC051554]|uniref:type I polyketide synthase n=1 Tax=Streptomyces sp. NPDC051554 TaxID=3365656 RepID=UPI00378B46D6
MSDLSDRIAGLSPQRRALLERLQARKGAASGELPPEGGEQPPAAPGGTSAEPVAVIGMGCRFPGGADDPQAYWRLLEAGVDATVPVPADRWDADRLYDPSPERVGRTYARRGGFLTGPVDRFDAAFFGISPREAESLDPQQRLLLEVAWEALEHGGHAPGDLRGSRTGVYVGIGIDDYKTLQTADEEAIDAYTGTGNLFCAAAGRISYTLGLTGPSMAVDTGCSSSLVAVHLAVRSLRAGECDMALAGGVHLMLSPEMTLFLSRAGALSPDGRCRTFDAAANGYARGEGCGVVLLKRLSDALAAGDEILAVIRGSAVNHDGPSAGLTVPNGLAQQALLRDALADAGTAPDEVDYLEAHGTGTPLGDPIEVRALGAVLAGDRAPDRPLLVGSVKTNIGHLEAAAGVASLIKVILALRNERIAANLHFTTPSPHIPWSELAVCVPVESTPWPRADRARVAGISSFGIGGTNAHLVVAEAPEDPAAATEAQPGEPRPRLLALSARGARALNDLAGRYADRLTDEQPWADVVHTTNRGRTHFDHRLAVVASTTAEARRLLAAWAEGREAPGTFTGPGPAASTPRIAFLFTGQGSQYLGMGRGLYRTQPVFRQTVDRCEQWLDDLLDRPLTEVLFAAGPSDGADLSSTRYAQPALFAVQFALTRLWASWGIRPDNVLGHSVGEYAAACAAGVLDPRDALRLVAARGRLMAELPGGGAMAAVFADAERVRHALAEHRGALSVAACNGPQETVVSGAALALDSLLRALESEGVRARRLDVSHAFHSPLMDPVLDTFAPHLSGVGFRSLRLPVFSTVTGDRLSAEDMGSSSYWLRNIREPVRFQQGLRSLLRYGCDALVEIGPQPVLTGLARGAGMTDDGTRWTASLARGTDDTTQILGALAQLHVLGADVDWMALEPGRRPRTVPLPTYPFQRRRHWRDTRGRRDRPAAGHPHLGSRLRSPAMRDTVFHNRYDTSTPAHLPDHLLFDTVVVPGASHLALLLSAVAAERGPGPREASEVVFPQALVLQEGRPRDVQFLLRGPGESPDGRAFEVVSMPADEEQAEWTAHAQGVLTSDGTWAEGSRDPVAAVLARCTFELSGARLHARMERGGYGLGPSFRWIRHLHHRQGELLAELATPSDTDDRHTLHPGLIDSCFQAVMALLPDEPAGSDGTRAALHVPVRIDRLRHHAVPQGTGSLWLHVVEQAGGRDRDGLVVDLTLLDADEQRLLTMEGVRLHRVARDTLLGDSASGQLRTVRWDPVPGPRGVARPAAGTDRRMRRWLILADRPGPADELGRRLTESGDGEYVLALAPAIDLASVEDVRRAVADAAGSGPLDGVVGLWTGAGPHLGAEASVAALHLVQAAAGLDQPPRLVLVTRGGQRVLADDRPEPGLAAVWGLGKVAAAELPHLGVTLVDIDPSTADTDEASHLLLAELLTDDQPQPLVAHRTGTSYVPGTVALTPSGAVTPRLRADATYLVTGGTGGVGLHTARHLAGLGARHLALLSRGAPGPDAERAVAELRGAGSSVYLVHADVADAQSLVTGLTALRDEAPPLRGIVHAAGVLDDGVLIRQDAQSLRSAAAPKTTGAERLREALGGQELDFFLLFSSAAAAAGTLGQGAYAAANAYLDALAERWRAEGLPVTSIAWGAWADTGMAAGLNEEHLHRLADRGVGTLRPAQALRLLDRVLSEDAPAYVIALRATRTAPSPAGPRHEEDTEHHPRPDGLGPYVPPENGREKAHVSLWEEALRIRPVGVEDDFFALGGDSMLALTITARARRLGLPVRENDFFSHPTVRGLVNSRTATEPELINATHGNDGPEAPADAATPALSRTGRELLLNRMSGTPATSPPHPLLAGRLREAATGLARNTPQRPPVSDASSTPEPGEAQS